MDRESKQKLIFEPATDTIIESLYPPVELHLAKADETLVDDTCPDCDSLLEHFYDDYGNPRFFCDNCGCMVHGQNSRNMSDMDISQESNC